MSFACPHCAAEVSLDIRDENQRRRLFLSVTPPEMRCPFCDTLYDSNRHQYFTKSFQAFRQWIDLLAEADREITFRLIEPEAPKL